MAVVSRQIVIHVVAIITGFEALGLGIITGPGDGIATAGELTAVGATIAGDGVAIVAFLVGFHLAIAAFVGNFSNHHLLAGTGAKKGECQGE